MAKSAVLAVQVAQKMFGALGQPQNRFEIDNLANRILFRGESLRKQFFAQSVHNTFIHRFRTECKITSGFSPQSIFLFVCSFSPVFVCHGKHFSLQTAVGDSD